MMATSRTRFLPVILVLGASALFVSCSDDGPSDIEPDLITRIFPARSVTSIRPSGRNAMPQGFDSPFASVSTANFCFSEVMTVPEPVCVASSLFS